MSVIFPHLPAPQNKPLLLIIHRHAGAKCQPLLLAHQGLRNLLRYVLSGQQLSFSGREEPLPPSVSLNQFFLLVVPDKLPKITAGIVLLPCSVLLRGSPLSVTKVSAPWLQPSLLSLFGLIRPQYVSCTVIKGDYSVSQEHTIVLCCLCVFCFRCFILHWCFPPHPSNPSC